MQDFLSQIRKGENLFVRRDRCIVNHGFEVKVLEQGIIGILTGVDAGRTLDEMRPTHANFLGKLCGSFLSRPIIVHPQIYLVKAFQQRQYLKRQTPASIGKADGGISSGLMDGHGVIFAFRQDNGSGIVGYCMQAKQSPTTTWRVQPLKGF